MQRFHIQISSVHAKKAFKNTEVFKTVEITTIWKHRLKTKSNYIVFEERKKEKAQTNEYEYNTLFIWDCPNQLSLNPFHFYIYTITLTITALSPRILREWGVPRYKLHCKTGSYWAIVQKSEGVEYMKHVCNSISANHEPKVKIQHHLHIKHWKLSQYVTTLHFHR